MINLKYSKDVVKDYDQITDGRKNYIIKRADKKGVCVSDYLLEKYKLNKINPQSAIFTPFNPLPPISE